MKVMVMMMLVGAAVAVTDVIIQDLIVQTDSPTRVTEATLPTIVVEDVEDPASEKRLPIWRPFRPYTLTSTVMETVNVVHTIYATCLLTDASVPACGYDAQARHITAKSASPLRSPTETVLGDRLLPLLEPSTTEPQPLDSSGGRRFLKPIKVVTETFTTEKTTATVIHSETVTVAIGGCIPPTFDIQAEVCSNLPTSSTSNPSTTPTTTTDNPTTDMPPETTTTEDPNGDTTTPDIP